MKKIGVLTSGGDAPGMNAAIRAVVRTGIYHGFEVAGTYRGYQGLIEGDIEELKISSVGDIIHRGGTMLRTARCPDFASDEGFNKGLQMIKMFKVDSLVVIGGDGSFNGARRLSEAGFPTVGIPGTIDNDLAYTDYTLGFDTALTTVVNAIGNIRDTSSSHGTVNVIEVMGRDCGDIALYGGLAGGAEAVIIPEISTDVDELCRTIIRGKKRGKLHSIILLAEGVGKPYELAELIKQKTSSDVKVSVIGYLQRGGTPTPNDRILGSRMGAHAVDLLMQGKYGRAIGIKGNDMIDMPFKDALSMKKDYDKRIYELARILAI
ncbi:MAG TPA: 6-phosphofructokinase [Clostridiales bacterium UBA8960]|nr:6-phosphofructokinase [Clostridiales bacterium UBA8960]